MDLGAEQFFAAEKANQRIAVEVKSFIGPSPIEDLKNAVGQFMLYQDILDRLEPDRLCYLAIREETFADLFEEPIGKLLLENRRVRLLVFDPSEQVIEKWIQ